MARDEPSGTCEEGRLSWETFIGGRVGSVFSFTIGGPNRDLGKSQGQTNHRVVPDKGMLTVPNAAREGRVDGAAGSTWGKTRGLFGYSTWHGQSSNN